VARGDGGIALTLDVTAAGARACPTKTANKTHSGWPQPVQIWRSLIARLGFNAGKCAFFRYREIFLFESGHCSVIRVIRF
jgi:hypothetical protein